VDQKMYPVNGDDTDNDACASMEESGCGNNISVRHGIEKDDSF
ncbi:hypothetical protein Tco_0469957, partial [Tanacetum coccineum]